MQKIFFITLSRSDYTTTKPVILKALDDKDIDVNVIVGGSHLLPQFGSSVDVIKSDGIPIYKTVDFFYEKDNTESDIAYAYSRCISLFVDIFTNDKPDRIFIIGDRWEMLAVASAASMLKIPIFHHSGGDITQGSADNQIRYALTNLSHFHFVALEEHKQRLEKIGEEPWRVVVTGEPALTEIMLKNSELDVSLGINVKEPFVLATFHPTSFDKLNYDEQVKFFTDVLKDLPFNILLTAPNPDPGNKVFYDALKSFSAEYKKVIFCENLGTKKYYYAMSKAAFMVGNSSSGIWEAPSFQLPVVNIGNRQQDRRCGDNVIHVGYSKSEVQNAIKKIQNDDFKKIVESCDNPYVQKDTLEKIITHLKADFDKHTLLSKKFIDPLRKD